MPSLWFIVPAHGRIELARVCLRQLRRTCDALTDIEATAVVIACDENLEVARDLGFGTIERDNDYLSARFNDGFQLACDPAINPRPADYAMPFGTDDWIDHRILRDLGQAVVAFNSVSLVREDGREMTTRLLDNPGRSGMRVYPRSVLATLDYRPADEDRNKGCDTSTLYNLLAAGTVALEHRDIEHWQLVDWKSSTQVTSYAGVGWRRVRHRFTDPFATLAPHYPAAVPEMREVYAVTPGA